MLQDNYPRRRSPGNPSPGRLILSLRSHSHCFRSASLSLSPSSPKSLQIQFLKKEREGDKLLSTILSSNLPSFCPFFSPLPLPVLNLLIEDKLISPTKKKKKNLPSTPSYSKCLSGLPGTPHLPPKSVNYLWTRILTHLCTLHKLFLLPSPHPL